MYVSAASTVPELIETVVAVRRIDDSIQAVQESYQPTIDAIMEEKRRREAQQAAEEQEKERQARTVASDEGAQSENGKEGIDGLADEADSQGAFNPETGEINWDCPCLGGMAHGPCGEEFKAAFSCFVYSTEEPKGVECIEKFK
jgi:intermembrane space import and assembly protein 40